MNTHRTLARAGCAIPPWILIALIGLTAPRAGAAVAGGTYASLAYETDLLDNGLKVIVFEDHELPVVTFHLMTRAGSALDPPGKEGLAGFTADLMSEGTQTRSAEEIARAIDFVGGSISASAGFDASFLTCHVLRKDYDLGLELLSDIVLDPAFLPEEIERQRSQILTGLIGERDQKAALANRHFGEILFGTHPYAHPVNGRRAAVESITRDDIMEFYDTWYRPNVSVIVVAGDVDRQSVVTSMREAFAGWQPAILPDTRPPAPTEPGKTRIRLVNKPDVTQSEIRIGYLGVSRDDPDFLADRLMNYTLGGGGFSSRLMKTVRAKKGLTYGVSSRLDGRVARGPFMISTFTRTETTVETIRAILAEVDRMKREGVTKKEVEDARAHYIGSWPLGLETPDQVAGRILDTELYGLGEDYLVRYTGLLGAVTPEDVDRAAARFLRTENLVIVVVANAEAVREGLSALGDVEEVFFMDLPPGFPASPGEGSGH